MDKCTEIIKHFEGKKLTAYLCPANVWTIGYGSTTYPNGKKVQHGDKISDSEAEKLLSATIRTFAESIRPLIKIQIKPRQFEALVSLAFNIGVTAFKNSTLLAKLNAGDHVEVINQFQRWNKAGQKTLPGLVRRRKSEANLYISGEINFYE